MAIKILSSENISGEVLIASGKYLSWGTAGATSIEGSTVSNKLQFRTNSTNAVIIDSSQNVGIGNFTNPSDGNLVVKKDGLNTGIPNSLTSASFSESGGQLKGLTIGYRTDETTAVIAARTATGDIAFMGYNGAWLETARFTNDNRLGIGTVSPASVLHIKDNSASPTQLSIQSNDFSRAEEINFLNPSTGAISGQIKYYTNPTVEYMSFSTSNNSAAAQRMLIDAGGSIIIGAGGTSGTPSADYRSLEIGRQGNTITGAPWKSNLYFSTNATITAGSTTFTARYLNELPMLYAMEDGIFTWSSASLPSSVGDTITFSEKMRIVPAGAVGIDNSSPDSFSGGGSTAASLVIGKGTSGVSPHITLWQGNSAQAAITFASANSGAGQYEGRIRYTRDTGIMDFRTNGVANVLVLGSTGNVGINSTNPGQKLAIEGSGSANENVLRVNNQANVSSRIWLRNSGQSAYIFNSGTTPDTIASGVLGQAFGLGINNNSPIQFYNGLSASVKMTILSSGNVGIGRTQADNKLEVEGNIKAKDIDGKIFSMAASWAYVASKNDLFSYPGTDGAVWEYTIKMNPNTAGSGAYRDYYYGKLGIGIGWNGSNVTQYIWQQQDQTAPRSLYDSGGGNFNPLFRMYYSGGVYTELAYNTAWTLRIQGLSTTTFGDIFFRRLA